MDMPLYEYRCAVCDEKFEKRLSFAEADQLPECPYCGSQDTRKQLSMFAASGGFGAKESAGTSTSCSSTGRFT
jgi:putative FmdB family regulatory protein